MRGWENIYTVRATYRRGTMSIYHIYFKFWVQWEKWYLTKPKHYELMKVEINGL